MGARACARAGAGDRPDVRRNLRDQASSGEAGPAFTEIAPARRPNHESSTAVRARFCKGRGHACGVVPAICGRARGQLRHVARGSGRCCQKIQWEIRLLRPVPSASVARSITPAKTKNHLKKFTRKTFLFSNAKNNHISLKKHNRNTKFLLKYFVFFLGGHRGTRWVALILYLSPPGIF